MLKCTTLAQPKYSLYLYRDHHNLKLNASFLQVSILSYCSFTQLTNHFNFILACMVQNQDRNQVKWVNIEKTCPRKLKTARSDYHKPQSLPYQLNHCSVCWHHLNTYEKLSQIGCNIVLIHSKILNFLFGLQISKNNLRMEEKEKQGRTDQIATIIYKNSVMNNAHTILSKVHLVLTQDTSCKMFFIVQPVPSHTNKKFISHPYGFHLMRQRH